MMILRAPPFPGVPDHVRSIGAEVEPADNPRNDISPAERDRAAALIGRLVAARVGGTFWAPPASGLAAGPLTIIVPRTLAKALEMADQYRDRAKAYALLPRARWSGRARSMLARRGIASHIGPVDPWSVLAVAKEIVSEPDDELAALAAIQGIAVSRPPAIPAAAPHASDAPMLAHHLLVRGRTYRDPFTGAASTPEQAIDQLGAWRRLIDRNHEIAVAAGISRWKRREVGRLLWAGRARPLTFTKNAATAVRVARRRNAAIAVWPSRAPAGLTEKAASADASLYRIEDGFVRSVGLGSGLHPPLSIVIDRSGIYFDPSCPSDLETILAATPFTPEMIGRAERLISVLVQGGVSKYSVGRASFTDLPAHGRRVLVAGQVEDDLSVRMGAGDVRGNLDLLRRARAAEPGAFILFKPHPDVEAGHRVGRIADGEAMNYADAIVRDVPMAALLDAVDAVHVLTSLTGFEALLRGREVVTHGRPFYAGWGLTSDLAGDLARRTRALSLAELVAGALILYPRYLDPVTSLPCEPEILIRRLSEHSVVKHNMLTRVRSFQGRLSAIAARRTA